MRPTRTKQPLCDQTLSVRQLNPQLTLELKRIGGRPRNISRVLDNPVDIPDGCSTNTNTSTNILQYRDCQINAKRWKDKIHLYLYLSSIKAASHWFIQTTCLYDYQLSPKRFMIVAVTSVESNALHLADFRWIKTSISPYNPRPSPVKWVGLNMCLMEFQQKSDLAQAARLGRRKNRWITIWINIPCVGGILMMYSQQWGFKAGLWPSPCDSPVDYCQISSSYIWPNGTRGEIIENTWRQAVTGRGNMLKNMRRVGLLHVRSMIISAQMNLMVLNTVKWFMEFKVRNYPSEDNSLHGRTLDQILCPSSSYMLRYFHTINLNLLVLVVRIHPLGMININTTFYGIISNI